MLTIFRKIYNSLPFIKLLKYNEASTIYYFMPSDLLVEQLKKEPSFNEKKFQACKQDLIKRKNDKLIIYNSLDELQKIVSTKFNCKLKVQVIFLFSLYYDIHCNMNITEQKTRIIKYDTLK